MLTQLFNQLLTRVIALYTPKTHICTGYLTRCVIRMKYLTHQTLVFSLQESEDDSSAVVTMLKRKKWGDVWTGASGSMYFMEETLAYRPSTY